MPGCMYTASVYTGTMTTEGDTMTTHAPTSDGSYFCTCGATFVLRSQLAAHVADLGQGPDEGDTMTEYDAPYSVYSLYDGALDDDEAYATIDEAREAFDALVSRIREARDGARRLGEEWGESTVHLYYAPWGDMLAETCIERA